MLKIKSRFLCLVLAIISAFAMSNPISAFAADYSNGDWNMVWNNATVVSENGGTVGTVYAGEGVTVLYSSGNRAYIEYSGSGGAKKKVM